MYYNSYIIHQSLSHIYRTNKYPLDNVFFSTRRAHTLAIIYFTLVCLSHTLTHKSMPNRSENKLKVCLRLYKCEKSRISFCPRWLVSNIRNFCLRRTYGRSAYKCGGGADADNRGGRLLMAQTLFRFLSASN